MPDKRALIAALRAELQAEIDTMTRLAREAAEAATHEENKPENDKDMRSTEASYVAAGQAARVAELERAVGLLTAMEIVRCDVVQASALVTLRHRGKEGTWFVVPAAGGHKLKDGGVDVQTITPNSPLGEALMGLGVEDEAEVATPQGAKVYEIVRIE